MVKATEFLLVGHTLSIYTLVLHVFLRQETVPPNKVFDI